MSFKAFSNEEIQEILDHMLGCMSKESLKQQIQKYGSEEKYREYLAAGFSNEQAIADVFKWYGSKEKAMEAIMQSTGDVKEFKQEQDKNTEIYKNREMIPSRAFAEGGIHEAIMAYEDAAFFEILAEELALRDLDAERATEENYDEVMDRMEQYMGEFEAHGTDHISVDLE